LAAAGTAGTIIALFAAGVAILAPCKLVEAAVWPRRVAELGILSERYRIGRRTGGEDSGWGRD